MFSKEGTDPTDTNHENEHEMEKLIREEYEFMNFVHNKCVQFYKKHFDHFEMKIEKGYHSVRYILTNIEVRSYDLLTDEEKEIHAGLQELK